MASMSFLTCAISIHALREEGDSRANEIIEFAIDFYPRPPRGGRHRHRAERKGERYFYPRPPRGGRPRQHQPAPLRGSISIHALREEGDFQAENDLCQLVRISIHALREEGDRVPAQVRQPAQSISIHALREEGDLILWKSADGVTDFYPRPPRGGRRGRFAGHLPDTHFYPRPPRGGRLEVISNKKFYRLFLSTPSARRATLIRPRLTSWDGIFLSTPSARRATIRTAPAHRRHDISIHALREEGDHTLVTLVAPTPYFYPRPPRGGRRFLQRI